MKFILLLIFFSINICSTNMERMSFNHQNEYREYLIYKPNNFNNLEKVNLLIGFHGYSGTASAFESEVTGGLNQLADKYNFLAIYPQGKYFYDFKTYNSKTFISSFNDLTGSNGKTADGEICDVDADPYPKYPECGEAGRCAWQSCSDDIGFIKSLIDDLKKSYKIENIYLVGNSNGGMFVTAFACKHPELLTAILSVNGMQAKDLSCTPDLPVNAILYGSYFDTGVTPVNIRSEDGYFYEPLENTVTSWKQKFQCNSKKELTYSFNEDYVEETYFDCKNDKKVISILNLDAEHMWPEYGYIEETNQSIYFANGYCATKIQSYLGYELCDKQNEIEMTDFFISKLLSFKN